MSAQGTFAFPGRRYIEGPDCGNLRARGGRESSSIKVRKPSVRKSAAFFLLPRKLCELNAQVYPCIVSLKTFQKGGIEMARYQPIASRLTLRLRVGQDEWGKPRLKSKSIAGIDVEAEAADVQAVASAIANLLAHPLVEVQKIDTDRVE